MFVRFLLVLLFGGALHAAGISYSVDFEGLDDPAALKTMKSVSNLTTLKNRPPASLNALRYRAESDIPELIKILHAYGYYEASVSVRVEEIYQQNLVIVSIQSGPAYKLLDYQIRLYHGSPDQVVTCDKIQLKNIDIVLGKPLLAQKILESQNRILKLLSECGYPLASIVKKEIIADGEKKGVFVKIDVDTGPLAHFGPTLLSGDRKVSPELFDQKLAWKEGETFDSSLVANTQKSLMDTGLFSTVVISHDEVLGDQCELPMKIQVTESKHRSVNIGGSYQTYYGFGLTFGWENRNIGGMGRRLSFQGDITQRSHSGVATYLLPDYKRIGQDWVWQAQAYHESITAYSERTYNLATRLERKFSNRLRIAIGGKAERLYVTASADNGRFSLLEVPLYVGWSTANNLLNPTRGIGIEYQLNPVIDLEHFGKVYLYQELTQSAYWPVVKSEFLVLAQKITFGSILSDGLDAVPIPKRFLGGSEEDLRGYRYRTVSPLHGDKPIGGRSAIYYTFETRFRVSPTIGLVPFFDMGNVQLRQFPTFQGEWFKSVGLGVRYFSFMGPFRLDVGFPLNHRKKFDDPTYRILVSVGQSF